MDFWTIVRLVAAVGLLAYSLFTKKHRGNRPFWIVALLATLGASAFLVDKAGFSPELETTITGPGAVALWALGPIIGGLVLGQILVFKHAEPKWKRRLAGLFGLVAALIAGLNIVPFGVEAVNTAHALATTLGALVTLVMCGYALFSKAPAAPAAPPKKAGKAPKS